MLEKFKSRVSNFFPGVGQPTKEQVSTAGQVWLNQLMSGKYSLNKKLIQDIYEEKTLTPHQEMVECRRMYQTNSHIVTGVETLKEIIIGDKLSVETNNDQTREFFEQFFEDSGFMDAFHEAVENFIITGNGYMEKRGSVNNQNKIMAFSSVPMSELIYKDLQKGKLKRYILEYPYSSQQKDMNYFTINYLGRHKSVRGREIPPSKLIHLKYGAGAYSEYGRSPLASSVNDGKVLREIEKSYALIARYKAIPKKIINLKNPDGTAVSDEDRTNFINNMSNLNDFENPITGKEVVMQDLSYGGKEVNLQPIIDYLKNKQSLPLAPSFYITGEETNYAVAHDQKNIFFLKVRYLRRLIKEAINPLLEQIARQNNLDPQVSLKFGEFSFEDEKEKENRVINKYKSGIISFEEAREELGLEREKEGENFLSSKEEPQEPAQQEQ